MVLFNNSFAWDELSLARLSEFAACCAKTVIKSSCRAALQSGFPCGRFLCLAVDWLRKAHHAESQFEWLPNEYGTILSSLDQSSSGLSFLLETGSGNI